MYSSQKCFWGINSSGKAFHFHNCVTK